jgi:sulfide-dependent adenosine diphosphate thiazole synthase
MKIDDITISEAIIKKYTDELLDNLNLDIAIVGGGPAGLCAGYYLAKKEHKVAIFERKLSVGGGMWGGGIMFNKIVVQKKAKSILDETGIRSSVYKPGYFVADSIESVSALTLKTCQEGVKIFNLLSAEDILVRKNKVAGIVINWSSVDLASLHVDPIAVRAKYVIDATGHDANIASTLERKQGVRLLTKTGKVVGEKSMWADVGEKTIVENTKKVYPGLYACGMAANAIFGGPRMGPIFGGMLLSGKKAADLIHANLRRSK